ncbi:MAG: transcriptional regulator, partial [Bacteroidota bacterium]
INFTFETKGLDGNEMIPPGVFHTLIENGITHGYTEKKNGYFSLKKEKEGGMLVYTLFNDSEASNHENITMGTGLRFVKAALEEQYNGKAAIEWKGGNEGWNVKIKVKE